MEWNGFKIGDDVKAIAACDMDSSYIGKRGKVISINPTGRLPIYVEFYGGNTWNCEYTSLENLSASGTSTKQSMSLKSKIKELLRKEPQKSFVKAGILDDNEDFTSEGRDVFLNYLLEKNQDDFNTTVVQPLLTAQEAEKSK